MSSLASNTIFLTLNRLMPPILGFVLIVLIGKHSSELLGTYTLLTVIYVIIQTLPFLGLTPHIMKEMAQKRDRMGSIIGTSIFFAFICAIIILMTMPLLSSYLRFDHEMRQALFVIGFTMFPFIIAYTAELAFVTIEQSAIIAITSLIEGIFRVGLSIWVLQTNKGLVAFFWVVFATRIFSAIVYTFGITKTILNKVLPSIDFKFLISSLKIAPVFFMNSILFLIVSRADFFILSKNVSNGDIGIYSVGYKILDFGIIFFTAFVGTVYPRLSKFSLNKKQSSDFISSSIKAAKFIMVMSISFCVVGFVNADMFVKILFPTQYPTAVHILRILIFSLFLTSLRMLTSGILFSQSKPKHDLASLTASSFIYVILLLILIPKYGIYGAALSCLIEAGFQLFIRIIILKNQFPISVSKKENLHKLLFVIILYSAGGIILVITKSTWTISIIVSILSTILFLWTVLKFKILDQSDFEFLGMSLIGNKIFSSFLIR